MIYMAVFAGVFCIHLLLKLNLWVTLAVGIYLICVCPIHRKLYCIQQCEKRKFLEVCEYLEILLYSFAREGKIIRAFEDVSQAIAEGEMKQAVNQAIERMEMVTDETEIYREAMQIVGEKYKCRRVNIVHDFLLHVEYYGGEIEQSVELLVEDKNQWQQRIQDAWKERAGMLREIVMSAIASLLICGAILYLPVLNVDVSKHILSQLAACIVIVLNDLVLLRGQKYMAVDWLKVDELEELEDGEKKLDEYRTYDEKQALKQSFLFAILPLGMFVWNMYRGKQWCAVLFLLVSVVCLNQHRIGQHIAYKRLVKSIQSAFPQWIMDLMLILQSENVYMALQKTYEHAPSILRTDLENLIARLEIDPESVKPYHRFLGEFGIPEVHSAMSTLYSLSVGNCEHMKQQLSELVKRNLEMMNQADKERMKDKTSGMYLLFLAPVMIASIKLLVDMAIFLLSFLTMNMM